MGRQPRIVTLLPAATEIVAALGRREALVGRSHECDYPPGVERLPVITKPRSQVSAVLHDRGGAIHATIAGLLEQALSIYEVDVKALAQLAPDVIVTQAQCALCAIDIDSVEEALSEIATPRPPARLHDRDLARRPVRGYRPHSGSDPIRACGCDALRIHQSADARRDPSRGPCPPAQDRLP
jgi:iron complex transport system substrate-binding protein